MPSYAQVADLFVQGAPQTAFQQGANPIPDGVLQAELDAVSSLADGSLAPRGQLPLLTPYPPELVAAVCKIATYNILSVRGLNPAAVGDTNLRDRYEDGMRWLADVRTQRISPPGLLFSPEKHPNAHQMPQVLSKSRLSPQVGGWAPNRGW
jgi:phage gp36-like protein